MSNRFIMPPDVAGSVADNRAVIYFVMTEDVTTSMTVYEERGGFRWALASSYPSRLWVGKQDRSTAELKHPGSRHIPSFGGPFKSLAACVDNAVEAIGTTPQLRVRHHLDGVDYVAILARFASFNRRQA